MHRIVPLCSFLLGTIAPAISLQAQETPIRVPGVAELPQPEWRQALQGVWRSAGDDSWSEIRYVRLMLLAPSPTSPASELERPDLTRPALIGQCTRERSGKLYFELLTNFGGVTDTAFYPPWHSTGQGDPFPPSPAKVTLVLEFLGYTRVKPFKRQFEEVLAPGPQQLRYLNPGKGSANMESPAWFFQYLRSLPTLRLTYHGQSAEFETTKWLAQLHREPLCAGNGA